MDRTRLVKRLCRGDPALEQLLDHLTDLRNPASWYPSTRKAHPGGRRLIGHVGPTNSGKTYAALEAFKAAAPASIYCGPLRLLAVETWERVINASIGCSLRTGEIRLDRRVGGECGAGDGFGGFGVGAGIHDTAKTLDQLAIDSNITTKNPPTTTTDLLSIACTTEMAPLDRPYRVAIIDEFQLMSDPKRGGAFTQAILGLNADEVHLCGEPAALDLLQALATDAGDGQVERRVYARLGGPGSLRLGPSLGGDLGKVRPGDCVVAFSKRDIFQLKRRIEQSSQGRLRCAVVYGSLPLESRSDQASRFNNHQESGYPVLVASDAVGMGLNLNISRIIFSSMEKFDGEQVAPVASALVRQIAGRAGRYGSDYPDGEVTTLNPRDHKYLQQCLEETPQKYPLAGLFPTHGHIEQFARLFSVATSSSSKISFFESSTTLPLLGAARQPPPPRLRLATILQAFLLCHRCDPHYFLTDLQAHLFLASRIGQHEAKFSIADAFTLVSSPIKVTDEDLLASFDHYVSRLARGQPAMVKINLPGKRDHPDDALAMAETVYRTLDLYLWLSQRFPDAFPQSREALLRRRECGEAVERALTQLTLTGRKSPKMMTTRPASVIEEAVKDRLGLIDVTTADEDDPKQRQFNPKQMIGLEDIDSIISKLDSVVKGEKERKKK